jgi:hypothetical protein
MLIDCAHIHAEELRDALLCQPERLVAEQDLHAHSAVSSGVEENSSFDGCGNFVCHC